jgi:hypothetical protein
LTPDTIYYSEDVPGSGHDSFNNALPVESNGDELRLWLGNFGVGRINVDFKEGTF